MNTQTVPDPDLAFQAIPDIVRRRARADPGHVALLRGEDRMSYGELDALMDRVAASLHRDGLMPGDVIAICANTSPRYAAVFLGALRAGVAVAPLALSSTPGQFAAMVGDAKPSCLFADEASVDLIAAAGAAVPCIGLEGTLPWRRLDDWLMPQSSVPAPVAIQPEWPFNIIYSSGTTGAPKGIVHSHARRWQLVARLESYDYGPQSVALLATPMYSNTTLVVFFPTLAAGGSVVLMPKFDPRAYLELAQKHRVTHTMLVPVQYQRIMALPDFGNYALSSFHMKFCTSAPFSAALKADVLKRWPGGLVEFYGMTEGGGSCILNAQEHPDKLHTVGKPAPGNDIRLIDDDGHELAPGQTGEIVGHSGAMMTGYHNQPGKTHDAEWFDATGKRFIRSGDIGRFDVDGFVVLVDRKKDMIISGGFNVYPSDLEAVLREHPAVAEVAVVGVPSEQWGETPVAYVVRRPGRDDNEATLMQWTNSRVGKTQRIAALHLIDELPRSPIGKVLKRELRDRHVGH